MLRFKIKIKALGSCEILEFSLHPLITGCLLYEITQCFTCSEGVVKAVAFSANSEIQILS